MRSPILALTWQHWGRHRLGLSLVLLCLLAFALLFHLLAGRQSATAARLPVFVGVCGRPVLRGGGVHVGLDCKLEGRESGFPGAAVRCLPVRTSFLVGWPMLQGVGVVTLLWAGVAALVLPADRDRPCVVGSEPCCRLRVWQCCKPWCGYPLAWPGCG